MSEWVKAGKDRWMTHDERFEIEALRQPSGRIRTWRVLDHGCYPLVDGLSSYESNKHGVRAFMERRRKLGLSRDEVAKVEAIVKALLHAQRDSMRNRGVDTTTVTYDDGFGYRWQDVGVMMGLEALGHGKWGAVNRQGTLSHWLDSLEQQVLDEEGFGGDNHCAWCTERWGKC